jgi:poly-beta-hydroxybutyrate-responsive repressor
LACAVISAYQVALLITHKKRRCSRLAAEIKVDARPRRWLTPVALVILRAQGSYGNELMERIQQFGFEQINPGTLYRTLRQMEREGLCTSELEVTQSSPPRRTYAITADGVAYLDAWAKACKEYQKVLGSFAQAYTSNRSLPTTSSECAETSS